MLLRCCVATRRPATDDSYLASAIQVCNQAPPEAIQVEMQAGLLNPRWAGAFTAWQEQQELAAAAAAASAWGAAGSSGGGGGYRGLQGDDSDGATAAAEDEALV